MNHRTITDLPTELLHTILSQVNRRYTLHPSSLTCKRLRDVSLEFIFKDILKVQGITTLEHLLRFLEANPRALKRIQNLTLSATYKFDPDSEQNLLEVPLDAALVARIVGCLPNLKTVKLNNFLYLPPMSDSVHRRNDSSRPRELRSLSIRGTWTSQCSISGLFQVLSLFSAQELEVDTQCFRTPDSVSFNIRSLDVLRSLAPERLHIDAHNRSGPEYSPQTQLLAALTKSLRLDVLRDLRVSVDSSTAARALGELLLRAGGSITALTLNRGASSWQSERDGWIDPLRDSWQKLNIEACTSLESISIPIYFGPSKPQKPRQTALASPIAHLLKHVSPTLRRVTIELRDLYRPATIASTKLLKLQELDEVVVVNRFPKLEHLRLEVYANRDMRRDKNYWSKCADAARHILPKLHARGHLVVWNITPWTYTF